MYVRCAELRCRILRLPDGNTARTAYGKGGHSRIMTLGKEAERNGRPQRQKPRIHVNGAESRYSDAHDIAQHAEALRKRRETG